MNLEISRLGWKFLHVNSTQGQSTQKIFFEDDMYMFPSEYRCFQVNTCFHVNNVSKLIIAKESGLGIKSYRFLFWRD